MRDQKELNFESVVPEKSVIGREWKVLKAERDKAQALFASLENKMEADTTVYRRSNMAVHAFLEEMLPLVLKAATIDGRAKDTLDLAASKAQYSYHGFKLDRWTEARIWLHHCIDRYRVHLPKSLQPYRAYHPTLCRQIDVAMRTFWKDLHQWLWLGVPWDGSQAMHSMYAVILKAQLLGHAND